MAGVWWSIATAFLLSLPARAADLPRVVTMNLCADQLAMMLADDGQLISVSRIASDPNSSSMVDTAAAYPLNNGTAEEIFLMRPDLVLGGTYSNPATVSMLRGLGVEVVQIPIVSRLNDIPGQIRLVGAAMGREAVADAMAAEVEARLAHLPEPPADRPEAAFFYPNGYSLGRDTLGHDIISAAGFRNLAEALDRSGGGRLPLEELLLHDPEVLISGQPYPAHSRSEEIVRHPALARWFDTGRVVLSSPDWVCGTPLTLRAVEQMVDLRAQLADN